MKRSGTPLYLKSYIKNRQKIYKLTCYICIHIDAVDKYQIIVTTPVRNIQLYINHSVLIFVKVYFKHLYQICIFWQQFWSIVRIDLDQEMLTLLVICARRPDKPLKQVC